MFLLNVLWQHILAAVLQNWGTTLNGIIGAAILGAASTVPAYIEGHSFTTTNWGLVGAAVWVAVWNSVRAKFSWGELGGVMLSVMNGAPRAQLIDLTKQNTGKIVK